MKRGAGRGLAAWSIDHPIGVSMIAIATIVLGAFSIDNLGVNLLPHVVYPEIGVRIVDRSVPATVMENQVTRQLEEQLAITEDAISVTSRTREGRSAVELSFEYGKDIDRALRDASSRLDRAKRFLPDTIDPPIIFKRDPSQIPVAEIVVSSPLKDPAELRTWVDDVFAKWFLNLPGVAAIEVGGGLTREVQVLPDQQRLAGLGLSIDDVVQALERGNVDSPGGRVRVAGRNLGGRTMGRFERVADIAALPLELPSDGGEVMTVRLGEVAEVIDAHADEVLRIRLDRKPGIKVSIQKQPQANTVAVVDAVRERLAWLETQGLLPEDVAVGGIADQAVYVRNALRTAVQAALSGALLAMGVVYLFLGNLRRTLIIGSAIPIAVMVTLSLMDISHLTLNIMTLGGLALGVGLLVDNTIVMLENIYRHQRLGESRQTAATAAAGEVNGAIVAATSTNLAAVLPFLFIGGLVGLLFRELIVTISAAILASLLVALTLVPALAARVPIRSNRRLRNFIDGLFSGLQRAYTRLVELLLRLPWLLPLILLAALFVCVPVFTKAPQAFLPKLDEGRVSAYLVADPSTSLEEMDRTVQRLEALLDSQPEVVTVYSQVGGFVFGRSQHEATNRASIHLQLVPRSRRALSSNKWAKRMADAIDALELAGVIVRIRSRGIRGIRLGSGDDEVTLRVQGTDLAELAGIGDLMLERLDAVSGLKNLSHSYEDLRQELAVIVDRERAADLGLSVDDVGRALRVALTGVVASDFIEGDRRFDVRLRLPLTERASLRELENILLFGVNRSVRPVYLGDVARLDLVTAPADIRRDNQRRIVEVSASLTAGTTLGEVMPVVYERLAGLELPPGYVLYDGGAHKNLQRSQRTSRTLLGLAIFLVFVVMAVQYESLRNPLVILMSVPFSAIGVAAAVHVLDMPLSMPLWLGIIMLAGIVVNNSIVLVETIEQQRNGGLAVVPAVVEAARLRLRPILMTTLTTVAGMAPLALGIGEGAEMLRPLATTIVWGLSFSMLVSLLLVPCVYRLAAGRSADTSELSTVALETPEAGESIPAHRELPRRA